MGLLVPHAASRLGRRQLPMSDDEKEDYEYEDDEEGYEDEDDEEDYYDDVELIPGAGQAEVDDETADFSARVERLAAWEEQLIAYNGKLAEEGWKSWKKGAVTSVMHELQRKVVPDVWRDEVREANERVRAMSEQLTEVRERERLLTERIDLLENGPGCARELKEQLEIAEVQLNQEQARQPLPPNPGPSRQPLTCERNPVQAQPLAAGPQPLAPNP